MCARARVHGTVWCVVSGLRGVLIGPLIVWNRTNKCVRVLYDTTVWCSSVLACGAIRRMIVHVLSF